MPPGHHDTMTDELCPGSISTVQQHSERAARLQWNLLARLHVFPELQPWRKAANARHGKGVHSQKGKGREVPLLRSE